MYFLLSWFFITSISYASLPAFNIGWLVFCWPGYYIDLSLIYDRYFPRWLMIWFCFEPIRGCEVTGQVFRSFINEAHFYSLLNSLELFACDNCFCTWDQSELNFYCFLGIFFKECWVGICKVFRCNNQTACQYTIPGHFGEWSLAQNCLYNKPEGKSS